MLILDLLHHLLSLLILAACKTAMEHAQSMGNLGSAYLIGFTKTLIPSPPSPPVVLLHFHLPPQSPPPPLPPPPAAPPSKHCESLLIGKNSIQIRLEKSIGKVNVFNGRCLLLRFQSTDSLHLKPISCSFVAGGVAWAPGSTTC